MRFDLRTVDDAKKFLIDWLEVNNRSLTEYILLNSDGIDVDDFCREHKIDLNEIEIHNLTYIASHVTTSSDELESIKTYGLMDLKLALSLPTPLKKFLAEHGIEFDIVSKTMKLGTEVFDVSYKRENFIDRDSLEGKLNSVAHKLFYDSQISSFFSMEGDKEYGGIVHMRPEFLLNVSEASKKNLEKYWTRDTKAFVLEYEEKFENFEWFTFYENEEAYYEDSSRIKHKKWLVEKALYRLWNDFFYNDTKEEYAYMKSSYTIPWENIINVREID